MDMYSKNQDSLAEKIHRMNMICNIQAMYKKVATKGVDGLSFENLDRLSTPELENAQEEYIKMYNAEILRIGN